MPIFMKQKLRDGQPYGGNGRPVWRFNFLLLVGWLAFFLVALWKDLHPVRLTDFFGDLLLMVTGIVVQLITLRGLSIAKITSHTDD